jgi:uracil-DNA glycosylase
LVPPVRAALDAVDPSWTGLVRRWAESDAGHRLIDRLDERLAAGATIFPARPLRALELTPLPSVRVVILGQDPYHGAGQAEGLAFSVPREVPMPPSLRNIVRELQRDLGIAPPEGFGHLGDWARRGVLLLNTTLTVEDGKPASHAKLGWEALTDMIVDAVAESAGPHVYLLWGGHAQAKAESIAAHRRGPCLSLACNHPSPLSAGRGPVPFVGCGHFGRANAFLVAHGADSIDWSLG